jgi:sirohydrochlorin ferrochelatase
MLLAMRALLLVDHGSRRAEANAILEQVHAQIAARLGPEILVAHAHMELARPSIAEAIDALCAAGGTSIYLMPWFLVPGRHAEEDVPRMAREALGDRSVALTIGAPMGADPLLIELALARFGSD